MIGLCVVFDTIDLIALFLNGFFGVGLIISFFNNVIASTTLFLWAMIKDIGVERTIAGAVAEMIPVINALPIRTIMMIMTVWLDWHPQQTEIAEKIIPNLKNSKRALGRKALAAKAAKATQDA